MRNRVLAFVLVATGGPILLCLALPAAIAGVLVSAITEEMMVQLKSWWSALNGRFSNDLLFAQCAQLDAVSKGHYIITQELMTVKCQVMRLRNDVESTKRRILFFEKRMEVFGFLCVVVKQLRLNNASSDQQMKDFSVQVVLCCRTLERARKPVYENITGHRWNAGHKLSMRILLPQGTTQGFNHRNGKNVSLEGNIRGIILFQRALGGVVLELLNRTITSFLST